MGMNDQDKTKAELLSELAELRQEIVRLKAAAADCFERKQPKSETGLDGLLLDLPDRNQVEADLAKRAIELEEVTHFLDSVIENLPVMLFIKDADELRFIRWNKVGEELTGFTREEFIGKNDYDFFPKEEANFFTAKDREVLNEGKLLDIPEEPIQTKHQGTRILHTRKIPIYGSDGKPKYLLGISEDITERKQAEEELRKLSRAVEQSASTIVITNLQGYIEYVNPRFTETTGYTLKEAVGQHTRILKSGETSPEEYKQVWETITAGHEWRGEFHNKKKNGQLYWESASISPIKNTEGVITHFLAVKEEISEKKQAEETLARRAAELQIVAQVGTAVTTILEVDTLLQEVVELTKTSFNLYHAHVYLLNETGDALVLAAGAGTVGRQMVSQGWSISLAQEHSLVARAARNRQPILVNDVRQEPDFLPNMLLPETRAEIVIPLIVGEQMLGVLDVQANEAGRFTPEDVHLKTILAGQVAVALQNARSFAEQQQAQSLLNARVKELNCLNEIGREIVEAPPIADLLPWVTERIPAAMQYTALCKSAIEYEGQIYGEAEAIELPCQIVHALRIGGEVVGRVYISYIEKREFLDEESALIGGIAGRLGGYIESRRLIEQIQQRATEFEETTNFLDSIIENIPIGIFVKKAEDLSFVAWNPANENLVGLKKEAVVGKNDYDLFPSDVADFFTAKDRKVLAGREAINIPEEIIETAHAGTRFLHTRKIPILGLDGQPKYLLGISEDITDRKRVEEVLRENETRLSEATSIAQLGYWELDVQSQMFTFTDQFYAIFHTTAEQEGGYQMSVLEYVQKFVHPDDAGMIGTQIREALEIGDANSTTYIEHRIIRADGSDGYILARFRMVKDDQGRIVKTIGANQDITERKQVEEKLRENEARLSEVLAAAKLANWEFDVPAQTFTFNDQFYNLFHTTAAQEGGYLMPAMQYAQKFVHPDDAYIVDAEIQKALEATDPNYSSQLEHRIIRADGSQGHIQVKFRIIKDKQGQTIRSVGANQDITERKQAELEREHLLADVESAYRQFVRREWEQFLGEQHAGGWHIEHGPASQSSEQERETLNELKNDVIREGTVKVRPGVNNGRKIEPALVAPIALRGEVIGTLSLQDISPDRKWTDEEMALVQAVSEQLALTVENLRLFDDTQKQASREQVTRQIADKMRAAPDVESIIQTGLTELGKALDVSRTYVKLTVKPEEVETGEV